MLLTKEEKELLANQKPDKELEKVQRKLQKIEEEYELVIKQYGLIPIQQAAIIRDVSRAAIADLVRRGRIRVLHTFNNVLVFYKDIENLKTQKPGPKRGSKKEDAE